MWVVNIVRQIVITGGNIAESLFLLATLWVITNAVAHTLVTWILSNHDIELVNNLSTVAFGALPELILISVICTCYNHWSVTCKRKSIASGIWATLYTLPALFFVVITVSAITTFVSTKGTQTIPMDSSWLVIRCLSGWCYAVVNMLFKKLGEPHYASQFESLGAALTRKQEEIERLTSHFENALQTANSNFTIAMQSKQSEFEYQINTVVAREIERLQNLLEAKSLQVEKLSERASSLERDELASYPKVRSLWVEKAKRTVSIDEIAEVTGLSKQRIRSAITSGKIVRDNRNKDVFRVASVVEWLKSIPAEKTTTSGPLSVTKSEQHTDPLPATNGHRKKDTQPLELVEIEKDR